MSRTKNAVKAAVSDETADQERGDIYAEIVGLVGKLHKEGAPNASIAGGLLKAALEILVYDHGDAGATLLMTGWLRELEADTAMESKEVHWWLPAPKGPDCAGSAKQEACWRWYRLR